MSYHTKHKAFNFIAILLIVSLLLPAAVKFTHAFSHHKHEVCLGQSTTHLHKYDVDCNFYKFQLNKNFKLDVFNIDFFILKENTLKITSEYRFLSYFQPLHFSLRGPPSLV